MIWHVLWVFLALIVLGILLRWGMSRPFMVKSITFGVVALTWAILRVVPLGAAGTAWPFIRPLNGGLLILLLLLGVVVVVFAILKRKIALWIAWLMFSLAVLLPIADIFTPGFWLGWIDYPLESKAIIVVLLAVGVFYYKKVMRLLGGAMILLAVVMILLWGQVSTSSPTTPTAPPPPQANGTAKPSETGSVSEILDTPLVGAAKEGFDGVVNLAETTSNTGFIKLVNDTSPITGFDWDKLESMSAVRLGDAAIDARQIVVFGADSSEISDEKARRVMDLDTDELKMKVIRAEPRYTDIGRKESVTPTGDDRVALVLTPFEMDGEKFSHFTYGSGVLIDAQDDATQAEYSVVTYEKT